MKPSLWVGAALTFVGGTAHAQDAPLAGPFLHPLFSENAVLQRDRPVPVWGWTKPGTRVVVRLDGQAQTAVAGTEGRWTVTLKPHRAGGPHTLSVADAETGETADRKDLLFGDVWLCSGQSNMAYDMHSVNDYAAEVAAADYPQIRLIQVPTRVEGKPVSSFEGSWKTCSPQSVERFAAVGYFFGRALYRDLKIPIGLIDSSASGTPGQAWVSGPALRTMPDYTADVDAIMAGDPSRPLKSPNDPTVLFNAKIAPLLPGAIKGVVWYQGESNADRVAQAVQYRTLLPTLIRDWRAHFGAETPFTIMQLANFRDTKDEPGDEVWPHLREAQLMASQTLPNVGLTVLIDLGEAKNVHFPNKQEAGRRLALSVREGVYGEKVESHGPTLKGVKVEGGAIRLTFDHGKGLNLKGDANRVFAVAGEDGRFYWAKPEIVGDVVILRTPEVLKPVSVRFGWSDNPLASLYNAAGLPASPFRTDK